MDCTYRYMQLFLAVPVQESHNNRKGDSACSTSTEPSGYAVVHDKEVREHKKRDSAQQKRPIKGDQDVPSDSGQDTDTENPKHKSPSKKDVPQPLENISSPSEDIPESDIIGFPSPDVPDDGTITNLETLTAPSSSTPQAIPASAMITGGKTDHQQEEMIAYIRELEEELRSKEEELKEAQADIQKKDEQLKMYEREIKQYKQEKQEILEKYKKTKAEKEEAESRHADLKQEVETLKQKVCDLDKKVEQLQYKCNESDERDRKRAREEEERKRAEERYRAEVQEKFRRMEDEQAREREQERRRLEETHGKQLEEALERQGQKMMDFISDKFSKFKPT